MSPTSSISFTGPFCFASVAILGRDHSEGKRDPKTDVPASPANSKSFLMERVATSIALVVENELSRQALKQEKERLQALLKVNAVLIPQTDLEMLLPAVGEGTRGIPNYDSGKLFVNKDVLAACHQGPLQHSVVLVGRNDKHSVDAIVRLFGGLYYFVNLAANYEGADFFDTMVYDAQHGGLDKVCMSKQSFRRWTK
jgi:hypothetical protein